MTLLEAMAGEYSWHFADRLLKVAPSCGLFNDVPMLALPDDLATEEPDATVYNRWKATLLAYQQKRSTPETDAVWATYALVQGAP